MRPNVALRVLAVVAIASGSACAFAACSSDSPSPSPSPQASATTAPTSTQPTPTREGGVYDPNGDAGSNVCDPPAGANEFYALSAWDLAGVDNVSMCRYRGKVVMIVNTASHCGYTPEYEPLQQIYSKYKAQGFLILGFPSKTFNQEFESGTDVSEFCTTQYGITFPMFAISNVNPPDENPIYTWLKQQPGTWGASASPYSTPIGWNFEKWLVSKKGTVATRFLTAALYPNGPADAAPQDKYTDYAAVTAAIEAELAK